MATKKKSAVTLLKELRIEHAALTQEVSKLTKERDTERSNKDYNYKQNQEARAELEQAHALLDALPGVGRKAEMGEYGHQTTYGLVTRIGAFLAARS